jgi:hypothetical protein
MAAVHPLGSTDPNDRARWLILQGTLKEADLLPLLETVIAGDVGIVTLDLCDLETLTTGGCWTIRRLADELWVRGCRLSVVFSEDGPVADALRSSGTMQHPRIAVEVSAPARPPAS